MLETTIFDSQKAEDIIIQYIRRALQTGELTPGMRLPAERKLAENFSVGRTHVRAALKKLENYGIIKTLPQSGSVIVGLDITALDGLIADILKLDAFDFASLAEMRIILEVNAARLCAQRCNEEDLRLIKNALDTYTKAYSSQSEETIYSADFQYHSAISSGAHNSVLHSMLMLITPDIMTIYRTQRVCPIQNHNPYEEHMRLFNCIREGNAEEASLLMHRHLIGISEFAKKQRNKNFSE